MLLAPITPIDRGGSEQWPVLNLANPPCPRPTWEMDITDGVLLYRDPEQRFVENARRQSTDNISIESMFEKLKKS
jgi:hypothetical protein